jgi:hypothetical protein
VFVTGYATSATFFDYVTLKYSSAGVPLWTNRYNGPENGNDYATAIAVDPSGNVHVTGYFANPGGIYDIVTLKYSAGGTALWTNRYPGIGPQGNYPYAIANDSNGNVFVTGYATSATFFDYVTLKYSSAGVPLWTNLYSGPGN